MSTINYEDFVYSEEENENEQIGEPDHHDDHDEGSVGSDDISTEANHLDNDIDEYASFDTDLEKHQYDQLRWNGISNSRKYVIKQKSKKTKTTSSKEDKPAKQPQGQQAVDLPKEGEIYFDTAGNLWYTHKNNDIYVSERATFHHWIRAELSQIENVKGTYEFNHERGSGNYNVTCFNEVEAQWGLQRPHYAPIMFEWERPERQDPTYPLDNLYHQGLLVIDYWRTPVRSFVEIPLVISSAFEGGYMEPATRLHSKMAYEDIRARMPPFIQTIKNGVISYKALSKASTFSGRSRHFREKAGAISWDKREGSSKIKAFIEEIVKPINNSTRGSRDLTKDEVKRLRLMNHGTKPGRAKPGTTKESKEKYIADTRKAAGLPATVSGEKAGGEDDERQELDLIDEGMKLAMDDDHHQPTDEVTETHVENYNFLNEGQENRFLDESMFSIADNHNEEDESITTEVRHAGPPRFVFYCKDLPTLRAMTEGEALMDPRVDNLDPRNRIPKFRNELEAQRDALGVTVDHFKEIFGREPEISEGLNYISEYCSIQDQMDEIYPDDAIALRRLGRWEGTIFDWERAQVVEDPCFGRRHPF